MSKCSTDETPVCCCMDVGTIMDNPDCTVSYSRAFANRAEAEQTLAALTKKAHSAESEPCKITPTFTEKSDGARLGIDFTFAREAKMLIFQLGLCQFLSGTYVPISRWQRCLLLFLLSSLCHSFHFPLSPFD